MLNDEVVDSLQKVNINLVYYGDNVTISVQRDKTLNVIYQSAYDYFKPHGKIKLYHKNKELTPFLNSTISKYFLKLKNIDILVKDTAKVETNLESKLNSNLNDNYKFDNNNYNLNSNDNKTSLPQNQRAMTYCWDCKKFPINLFCRDCCSFICKNCRMDINNSHYSHRTITLYPENLAKSANLYKNVLIEDLNEIQKNNKNGKKLKDKSEINIDIEKYKKHLFEKVNRLLNKIKQIKNYQNEINYYINNKNQCKEKINKAIKDVKNISNEFNNKNIEDNEGNLNSQSNLGDLKDTFTKINNIEKNTQKICKIGKSIEEWEDINSKLEIALKTVENKIYSIITGAMNYGEEQKFHEDNQQKENISQNNDVEDEKKDIKNNNNDINNNININNNANNISNNDNNNNISNNDNNIINGNNNIDDNYNMNDNKIIKDNDNANANNISNNNDNNNGQIENKALEKEDIHKDINPQNIENNNLNQGIKIEKNKNNENEEEDGEEYEYEYEYEEVDEEEEIPDVKN